LLYVTSGRSETARRVVVGASRPRFGRRVVL